MAHRQAGSDLLGAVLQEKFYLCHIPDVRGDARRVAVVPRPHFRQVLCLPRAVAPQPPVTGQFAPDGGRVAVEQLGDLVLFVACSAENINLVSFVLGQVGVVHWATSTWRLMGLNAHAF